MNSCSPPDSTRLCARFSSTGSAEAAERFGYTPGSFRVLCHEFRKNPQREFFLPQTKKAKLPPPRERLRQKIITLRKQNSSVDIRDALDQSGEKLSPASISTILKEEGFVVSETQCCGRGRRRKARPVRAHVPNEGGRPVPVPSVPCQDPSRQDAGRCQVPRHEDDAGRTCELLAMKLFGMSYAWFAGLNVIPGVQLPHLCYASATGKSSTWTPSLLSHPSIVMDVDIPTEMTPGSC